jgi:hypothetical protein
MFAKFLDSILNFKFNNLLEARILGGRFTLVNSTTATTRINDDPVFVNLELSSDFSLTNVNPIVTHQATHTDYSGYNSKYVNDDGSYNAEAALAEFAKTMYSGRLTRPEMLTILDSADVRDSHESYIYNLLVSWFMAKLYKDSESKNRETFTVSKQGYSDSHVTIEFNSHSTVNVETVTLGLPVGDLGDLSIDMRTSENYWNRPYVFRYSNATPVQAAFYIYHLSGRERRTSLNVDVDVAGIDTSKLLFDPVVNRSMTLVTPDAVPWHDPDIIWSWVIDYVQLNRVEHAFAAAFETLSALAAVPMPSYQESTMWDRMQTTINFSAFSPTRARIRSNLEGVPYRTDNARYEVAMDDMAHPNSFIHSSAILNYSFYVGLYSMIDNYARSLDNWRGAFVSFVDEMAILQTVTARAAIISTVFGKDTPSCMNGSMFLSFNVAPMFGVEEIVPYKVHEKGYPQKLSIDMLHPYVSGSLLLGAVSADFDSCQHLHSLQKMELDVRGTSSPIDTIKIANMYRLFGYDVKAVHSRSGEQYPTYANFRECVVTPAYLLNLPEEYERVVITKRLQREGRSTNVQGIEALTVSRGCTMTIITPTISVVQWQQRSLLPKVTLRRLNRRKPVTFLVDANLSMYNVPARAHLGREVRDPSFQRDISVIQPMHPVQILDAGTVAPEDLGEPSHAETVD